MQVDKIRLVKACSMVLDEIVRVSAGEDGGFAFVAEFHVDPAGFVRAVKTNKLAKQTTLRVDR